MLAGKPYTNRLKRLFDLVVAVLIIVIFSPILVFIGLLVRVGIGSPILFRQTTGQDSMGSHL